MTINLIKDKSELYKHYRLQIADQTKVMIAVHGVPDAEKHEIRKAIQELLTAEVIKLKYDELRARGVNEKFLDAGDLRSSLKGIRLSKADRAIAEAKIRLFARQMIQTRMLPQNQGSGPTGKEPREDEPYSPPLPYGRVSPHGTIKQSIDTDRVCICITTGTLGVEISFASLTALSASDQTQNYAIALKNYNIFGVAIPSGDVLLLEVEPGAQFGIGSKEMQVGLKSDVWYKEIMAWHACKRRVSSVYKEEPSHNASYMLLSNPTCDGGADTLVFRKPDWTGLFWYDISYFDLYLFWKFFGGKRLTFTWLTD